MYIIMFYNQNIRRRAPWFTFQLLIGHEPEPDVLTLTCSSIAIPMTAAFISFFMIREVKTPCVVLTGIRCAWLIHCNIQGKDGCHNYAKVKTKCQGHAAPLADLVFTRLAFTTPWRNSIK